MQIHVREKQIPMQIHVREKQIPMQIHVREKQIPMQIQIPPTPNRPMPKAFALGFLGIGFSLGFSGLPRHRV
jgi:hypothetical protein